MNMPEWWIAVSGIFYICAIVAAIALAVLLIKLLQVVKDVGPAIKRLSDRVEAIGAKVEGIADKVDSMTSTAKHTVEDVGDKAGGVAAGLGTIGLLATQKATSVSSWLTVAAVIYRMLNRARAKVKK